MRKLGGKQERKKEEKNAISVQFTLKNPSKPFFVFCVHVALAYGFRENIGIIYIHSKGSQMSLWPKLLY